MTMPEHTDEEKELREILAQEAEREGAHGIARDLCADNIIGGWPLIALAAMRRLSPAPQAGQTCQHKHTSVPRGWARSDGASETSWHCLDCGKQFKSKSEGREPDEPFPLPQNAAPQAGQVTEEGNQRAIWLASLPGYPWLPCPICKETEGCDHTVPERVRATLRAALPITGAGDEQERG